MNTNSKMVSMMTIFCTLFTSTLSAGPYAKLSKFVGDPTCSDQAKAIQYIYFGGDGCLDIVGPFYASIIRQCNAQLTNITALACTYEVGFNDSQRCESCQPNRNPIELNTCEVFESEDYGDDTMYRLYECVAEMDEYEDDEYYADMQLSNNDQCDNIVYREVIPVTNTYDNHCVKAPGLTWRYLYFCDADSGELKVVNDVTEGSYCPSNINESLIDDNLKYTFTSDSTCKPIPFASTWDNMWVQSFCGGSGDDGESAGNMVIIDILIVGLMIILQIVYV